MSYEVKKSATISGVSLRTYHISTTLLIYNSHNYRYNMTCGIGGPIVDLIVERKARDTYILQWNNQQK